MAFRKNLLALSFVLCWIGCGSVTVAGAQLDSVTIGFSSFSGFYGPLWLAVEDGLGKKYGVDLRAVSSDDSWSAGTILSRPSSRAIDRIPFWNYDQA